VQLLAASFHSRDQVGLLQNAQVFADGLARHIQAFTEIIQCLAIFGSQTIEQIPRYGGQELSQAFRSAFRYWRRRSFERICPMLPGSRSSFGYCVGFIMAVLSRQQLFTESTITAVLPVAAEFTWKNVGRMTRLWAIVLAANLTGTLFAALFCSFAPVLSTEIYAEMLTIGRDPLAYSWWEMVFRTIASGFLMAAMVWLMPGAERTQFHVITLMTWLIAVGGFTHIVAGSMEAYLLVLAGDWAWWQMLVQFIPPVLIGNMIGGTALFALISYAQVMDEI
jgi:formate/nitrite transporter FocA (FNT family)